MTPTRELLRKDGYLIVPGAVPADLCDSVVADIHRHLKSTPLTNADGSTRTLLDKPMVWKPTPNFWGMVEMYHYQSMWDVRQHPAVHAAFAGVLGTAKLWVSIDRVNYKPPLSREGDGEESELHRALTGPYADGFLHWDMNVNQWPRPFEVQGLVALTDTDPDMGGFQCVPDLYRRLDDDRLGYPNRKIPSPQLDRVEVELWKAAGKLVRPAMKRGDLLVWDSALPHGNFVNHSDRTRYCQYLTMFPAPDDPRLALERVDGYVNNLPPSGWAFPGDPRELERKRPPAKLTELGKKLLGDLPWEE